MSNLLNDFNPIHFLSLFVCGLLVFGVWQRRKRHIHIPAMLSAILIDLGMVLYIEISRGAVKSAQAKLGTLMIVHIIISVSVLVLYGVHVWTGIKMARGGINRGLHGRIMPFTVGLRILNFLTSIMVMGIGK
ncbi:MAG: hypothetical protein ACYTHJ_01790 [Planctomycetota bacterium]|jgi:uncharacterized membrane protein YozB (DUF420 family)